MARSYRTTAKIGRLRYIFFAHGFEWFTVAAARSYGEPTAFAKRLFSVMVPFLTPRAYREKNTSNRPQRTRAFEWFTTTTASSYREPTPFANLLLSLMVPFLTARA